MNLQSQLLLATAPHISFFVTNSSSYFNFLNLLLNIMTTVVGRGINRMDEGSSSAPINGCEERISQNPEHAKLHGKHGYSAGRTTRSTLRQGLLLAKSFLSNKHQTLVTKSAAMLRSGKTSGVQSVAKLKEIHIIGDNHGQHVLSDLRDEPGLTRLQVAVKKGRTDYLEAMVAKDWASVECLTTDGETLGHLALKNDQFACFEKWMLLLIMHDQEELLNLQDADGNTALHIATFKKQTRMLLLLLENNPKGGPMVRTSIQNKEGLTALQLHSKCQKDPANKTVDKHITELHHKASHKEKGKAKEGDPSHSRSSLPESPTNENQIMPAAARIEDSSIFLQVLLFFAGVLFCAGLINFRNIYPVNDQVQNGNATVVLSVTDVIASRKLQSNGFYFIVIATLALILCMVILMVLTWLSLARTRSPFLYRAVMLFLLSAAFVICAFMVDAFVPHFVVSTIYGSYKISSFLVVCIYCLVLIIIVITVVLIVKLVWCFTRVKCCSPQSNDDNSPSKMSALIPTG